MYLEHESSCCAAYRFGQHLVTDSKFMTHFSTIRSSGQTGPIRMRQIYCCHYEHEANKMINQSITSGDNIASNQTAFQWTQSMISFGFTPALSSQLSCSWPGRPLACCLCDSGEGCWFHQSNLAKLIIFHSSLSLLLSNNQQTTH